MMVAGIDIGSITTETVILQDNQILGSSILPTGAKSQAAAERSLATALQQEESERGRPLRNRHHRIRTGILLFLG